MIKAILFDLDNTLIDFMGLKKRSCEAAVTAMINEGITLDKEEAMKILYDLYDKYGIEYKEIFQRFLEKIDKKIDYRVLAAGIIAYRKEQSRFLEPYPNVIPTLIKLKEIGLKLAIVSDAPRLKAWTRLYELGLQDFFDAVVAFGDTEEMKPSRLPFEKALKELKIDSSEALHVGDRPERDIEGAKKMGIKACFAKYGYSGKKVTVKADYTIDDISDLVEIANLLKT